MEAPIRRGTKREFPWALVCAVAFTLGVGALLVVAAPRYADSRSLFYLEKLRVASEGPAVDVMILGASQAVAAIQPAVLAKGLPPGTRVYNYAAPAMAPSGGEVILRRYLEGHPPPKLLVMAFTPMMYGDRRGEFERFTLKDALGPREVALAIWADRRPAYLLSWLSTRIGTVRFREGLRTGVLAWVLDRVPPLRKAVFDWRGFPEDHELGPYRFDFLLSQRARRNDALRAELEKSGGWHYWKETAFGGTYRQGATGWQGLALPAAIESFEPSPREHAAVRRILALCREHDVSVYVPTVPHAAWFARKIRVGPGETALLAFWEELAAQPGVTVGPTPTRSYPQHLFSDTMHLKPEGAERFSRELQLPVARAYAAATRSRRGQ